MYSTSVSDSLSALARAISKEHMASLPIRRYEGPVCVVSTQHDLDRAREDIGREHVVGFDTETRPAFAKGEFYLPCLVQVATARGVYLFQFREIEVKPLLRALLEDTHTIKVGVSLANDVRTLKEVFAFEPRSMLDLGRVARRHGFAQTGVRNLAGIFLTCRIPKGAQTSNWAVPRLTPQQITYAATDAWICRELYLKFATLGMDLAGTEPAIGEGH
ncbi:MAG: 3'-5' exonuclease [Pseudomonadota bacterium]